MMLQLAQLPSPETPTAIGWAILVFFGLMGGLYYTLGVWGKLRGEKTHKTEIANQPVEFRSATEFATKEEHTALETKVEMEFSRERQSRLKIYERLEAQGLDIASLKADSTTQTRQLMAMDQKMDQVLLRLPRSSS